jgi:hypothetical protein
MLPFMVRTVDWACVIEHGAAAEHAVPEPVGETYKVAAVAAWDTAGAPKTAPTAAISVAAAARADGRRRPSRGRVLLTMILPLLRRDGAKIDTVHGTGAR